MGDIVAFVLPTFNAGIVLPRYHAARRRHLCTEERPPSWLRNDSLNNEFVEYLIQYCVREQQRKIEEARPEESR